MLAGTALSVRLLVYAGLYLFIISWPYLYMVVCELYAYNLTPASIKFLRLTFEYHVCINTRGIYTEPAEPGLTELQQTDQYFCGRAVSTQTWIVWKKGYILSLRWFLRDLFSKCVMQNKRLAQCLLP